MFKNVASQKFTVFAMDLSTGGPKTGDAANIAAYISKDNGAVTQLTDTTATEMDATNAPGYYLFDATQAETNADQILLTGKSSTANIKVFGAPAMIYTNPPNFTALAINASGRVKFQTVLTKGGTALRGFFNIFDSATHNLVAAATGLTATRSLDGAAFAAGTLGAVQTVGNGLYYVDLATGDLAADCVTLRVVGTGYEDVQESFYLEP